MVFAGLYPVPADDYEDLRDAMDKLRLNDASFTFEPESSGALGFGFRCGFLGLLHMEIIQERLEREFDLDLITTAPGVRYVAHTTDGKVAGDREPREAAGPREARHSWRSRTSPPRSSRRAEYVGGILALAEERRGEQKSLQYLTTDRVLIEYDFPLAEVIYDFYDRLKSISRGYASFDYEMIGYRRSDLVKLDILVNGEPVDALSLIVHRDKAYARGKIAGREDEGADPPPALRGRAPGGHRLAHHRPRDHPPDPQERHRQVLRRRHHPQAQAPREAEGRQEAHEAGRPRGHPAGGVPGRAAGGLTFAEGGHRL